MEGRRTLAHTREVHIVSLVETVHGTCKPRLGVVEALLRTRVVHNNRTTQFDVALGEHVVTLTPHIHIVCAIVLMTGHHLNVVLSILLVPVQTLLVVLVECAVLFHCCRTILALVLAKIGIGDIVVAGFVEIYTVNAGNGESIGKDQLQCTHTVELVAQALAGVHQHVAQRIALSHIRTCNTKSGCGVTIVIGRNAGFVVGKNLARSIAHIHRVDGSQILQGEHVASRRRAFTVAFTSVHIFAVIMCVRHIGTQLQP